MSKIYNNTTSLQEILEAINNLPDAGSGGIELPELSNPANADEIFLNKETIDANGDILTGTFTIDSELSEQDDLLVQITTALEGKAAGGEQATPEIEVNNSTGLITAIAGAKSSTYQLAFQAAKTITPSTISQIAVSSGYYTGGNITVAGDSNLIASNIKSGVSIFGVNGTLTAGGSGANEEEIIAEFLETEPTIVENSIATKIRSQAFYICSKLTTVSFPVCTTIGLRAFYGCSKLTTVSFPICTTIGNSAFYGCSKLTTISFPICTTIGSGAFQACYSLTTVSFPICTSICGYAFQQCRRLSSLTLGTSTVCPLINSNVFSSTPYAGYSSYFSGTPYIYVPASLIDAYKNATNWVYFSSYFSTIESLEE